MTTAIYARCSSEESAMKGLLIENQVERCKTRAGEIYLEVVTDHQVEWVPTTFSL